MVTSGTITGALSSTGGALGVLVPWLEHRRRRLGLGRRRTVWLGGPLLCPGNTLTGAVTLTGNTGGISFEANHLTGALDIANNGGGVLVTGNSETGTQL